jgi:hypothetical protein
VLRAGRYRAERTPLNRTPLNRTPRLPVMPAGLL